MKFKESLCFLTLIFCQLSTALESYTEQDPKSGELLPRSKAFLLKEKGKYQAIIWFRMWYKHEAMSKRYVLSQRWAL